MVKPKAARESDAELLIGFLPGAIIYAADDPGADMFVIEDGEVELVGRYGPRERRLALLGPGDFFGEMSLLDDRPRSASARALCDARLVRVDGARFAKILRRDPEISIRIMRKLASRLRETDDLVKALMSPGVTSETSEMAPEPPPPTPVARRVWGLAHRESGTRFEFVEQEEIEVGRNDPVTGIQPQVDLSPVDPQRSSSRRHARIARRGKEFRISEDIGTTNGTFLNEERLEPGEARLLSGGDRLRFGLVELEFFVG